MERYPLLWIRRGNIVKTSIQPKHIYGFNKILIKIPMAFFTDTEETILNLYGTTKDHQIAKEIQRKKNKAGDLTLPDFKVNFKAVVIEVGWY